MTDIPQIPAEEAAQRIESGALLLDVREPDEWAAGHAPGAKHVPLGELAARIDELPNDRPIVAVCRAGGRSGQATQALVGSGYDVVNLAGGMRAWDAAGQQVVTDDGATGTVI
ncbi:MAG TPA: rhodanese-like domain-containing protein [Acidimicrobiales bacterium]|nr:rhodanese-like domain-containing protein [Acidimicrobiales bacterium]